MAIDQIIAKLDVQNAVIQQYAVLAIFDHLQSQSQDQPSAPALSAIKRCLLLNDKAALETAVQRLIALTTASKLPADQASDLLLTAMSACPPITAGPLASGLVRLFSLTLPKADVSSDSTKTLNWKPHVLSKALLANPGAESELLTGATDLVIELLLHKTSNSTTLATATSLAAIRPFISFCLVDTELAQQRPSVSYTLHSNLARRACSGSYTVQQGVLALLASHLVCYEVGTERGRAVAGAAVMDVLDLLESFEQEPGVELIGRIAGALIQLCKEAILAGGSPQVYLTALNQLADWHPDAFPPYLTTVAHLPAMCFKSEDIIAALHLFSTLLEAMQTASVSVGVYCVGQQGLLQLLAFQQSMDVKRWAQHAQHLLPPITTNTPLGSCSTDTCSTDRFVTTNPTTNNHSGSANYPKESYVTYVNALGGQPVELAASMLDRYWQEPTLFTHQWLHNLLSHLLSLPTASLKQSHASQQLAQETRVVVLGLLQGHPSVSVQVAVGEVLKEALRVDPLLGISALPVVVQRIQHLIKIYTRLAPSTSTGVLDEEGEVLSRVRAAVHGLLVRMLYVLPHLARHPDVLPFIIRVLQPLQDPAAPILLQAVVLRLLCEIWVISGRGFNHLEAAILGFALPPSTPPLTLRMARAECLKEVCIKDGGKAITLIAAVQEAVEDLDPAVHAVGLDCIAELCESDTLDFYAAWKVVHKKFPRLPQDPTTATSWLRLLSFGFLDADNHPEVAIGIVDALWDAMEHSSLQVRAQAYASLAAYDMSALDQIEVLPPLCDYARLLQLESTFQKANRTTRTPTNSASAIDDHLSNGIKESSSSTMGNQGELVGANEACERLVQKALRYEHATRRKHTNLIATKPNSSASLPRSTATTATGFGVGIKSGTDAVRVMNHRLVSSFPRQLLGGGSGKATDVITRLVDTSAAVPAVLYLYAPPLSPSQSGGKDGGSGELAKQAKQAAGDYLLVFSQLVALPVGRSLPHRPGVSDADALRAAWKAYLKRWSSAEKDSRLGIHRSGDNQGDGAIVHRGQAAHAAYKAVWESIHRLLHSSIAATENVIWAATALCNVSNDPPREVIHAVHAMLMEVAGQEDSPHAARCAALQCLGQIAAQVKTALGVCVLLQSLHLLRKLLVSAFDTSMMSETEQSATAASRDVGISCAHGLAAACNQLSSSQASWASTSNSELQNLVQSCLGDIISAFYITSLHLRSNALIDININIIPNNIESIPAAALADGIPLWPSIQATNTTNTTINRSSVDSLEELRFIAAAVGSIIGCLTEVRCTTTAAALHNTALAMLSSSGNNPAAEEQRRTQESCIGWCVAGCEVLAWSLGLGFGQNWVSAADVTSSLQTLMHILRPRDSATTSTRGEVTQRNGKVQGAVACTISSILQSALKQGYTAPGSEPGSKSDRESREDLVESVVDVGPQGVVDTLISILKDGGSGTMYSGAAVKHGIASALSSLLQSSALPPGSVDQKKALTEVERLASVKEGDLRVRQGCGWPAAEVCYHARHASSSATSSSSTAERGLGGKKGDQGAVGVKGLEALSSESAMKVLVQTLLDGTWPPELNEDGKPFPAVAAGQNQDQEPLTACTAASILRCIASSPRIPALDWTTTCRKLIKTTFSDKNQNQPQDDTYEGNHRSVLFAACVELAAAHGPTSQTYQLSEFIATDLLEPSHFYQLDATVQEKVLLEMGGLLAALPLQQAVQALTALASQGPSAPPSPAGKTPQQRSTEEKWKLKLTLSSYSWYTAFLSGLHTIFMKSTTSSTAAAGLQQLISPQVVTAAWSVFLTLVLPKLPLPIALPINLLKRTLVSVTDLNTLNHTFIESSGIEGIIEEEEDESVEKCWIEALRCLRTSTATPDQLIVFAENDEAFQKYPIHMCYAVMSLVDGGVLSIRALQRPRNLIYNNTLSSLTAQGLQIDQEGQWDCQHAVAAGIAKALQAQASLKDQLQWLLDVFTAVSTCSNGRGAMNLAACIAACIAGHVSKEVVTVDAVGLSCREAALSALAKNLSTILQSSEVISLGASQDIIEALQGACQAAELGDQDQQQEVWGRCLVMLHSILPAKYKAELCALASLHDVEI